MATTISIGGSNRSIRSGSLFIAQTMNGVDRMDAEIISVNASYRPAIGDEVIVTEGVTKIFGGHIHDATEMGLGGVGQTAIVTRISCLDYSNYADRRFIKADIAAGNLKAALTALVTYLSTYGVTLDAAQVNGPSLDAMSFDYVKLTEILNQLATVTGYVWEIDYNKVLRMFTPGTSAASFNIADNDGNVIGDLEVEPSRDDQYANRVIVIVPETMEIRHRDDFNGTGAQVTFTLGFVPNGGLPNGGVVWYHDATLGYDIAESMGLASAVWIYDPVGNTITDQGNIPGETVTAYRTFPISAGKSLYIYYDGTFSATVQANDAGQQASQGLWEVVLRLQEAVSADQAQQLADGELVKRTAQKKLIRYNTYQTGILPGQTQTINSTLRNVNVTALVQDISIRDPGRADNSLLRSVVTFASGIASSTWRDTYKEWAKIGEGSGDVSTVSVASTGGGNPAPPVLAVQYNKNGSFGGSKYGLLDPDGVGDAYGVEGRPTTLAIGTCDQIGQQFAIWNSCVGKRGAFTIWQENDGDTLLELDSSGGDIDITAYSSGDVTITGRTVLLDTASLFGGASTDPYVLARRKFATDSHFPSTKTRTTNLTIDSLFSGGGIPEECVFLNSTANRTVTLTGVNSCTAVSGLNNIYRRRLEFRNINSGTWTFGATDGLEGTTGYILSCNQGIIINGSTGGWNIIASYGTGTGSASAAGNTNDIQYNNGGSLSAEDAFAYDPAGNHFFLTTDHTNYGTGTIFSAYTFGATSTGNLALLDLEPGLDGTVVVASCHEAYGMYLNPKFRGAAGGTHALFAGAYLDQTNMSSGSTGATITEAATLYVNGAPAFGTNNHGLFVANGASAYIDGTMHATSARFGTFSTAPATTVTGWITVQDFAGNTRKLAVVTT